MAITSPEQSYTLGFLWGDGHLGKIDPSLGRYYAKIEIVKKDYDNVGSFFQCFGKWSEKTRLKYGCQDLTRATLFDGVFGAFLKTNDYDKKSLVSPSKILSVIPINLHEYFWRGFIDADGCFGWNRSGYFSITGNYRQKWHDFEKLLRHLKIKYTLERKSSYSGSISRISIYNKNGINALGRFIYNHNNEISLKRKQDKFLSIISGYST